MQYKCSCHDNAFLAPETRRSDSQVRLSFFLLIPLLTIYLHGISYYVLGSNYETTPLPARDTSQRLTGMSFSLPVNPSTNNLFTR